MVFLIQNSQNRDAAAIQAKLDELIRSVERCARNKFIGVEHLAEQQLHQIRAALEVENGVSDEEKGSRDKSVDQLLDRLTSD